MDGFDPDVELMLKVRNGDTESFNAILNKYQRPIINYLFRCLNRMDEAEELAQEVFLRVYAARHRYEPTAKLSSWIYKIATNLFLKELGRRRRMPAKDLGSQALEPMESAADRIADNRPTVLQDMEAMERERLISESMILLWHSHSVVCVSGDCFERPVQALLVHILGSDKDVGRALVHILTETGQEALSGFGVSPEARLVPSLVIHRDSLGVFVGFDYPLGRGLGLWNLYFNLPDFRRSR